jgi:hypothetical protein
MISALDAKMGQKARFSLAPGSIERPDGDYSGIRKKALLDASNCGIIINGRKRDFGKFEKIASGPFLPPKISFYSGAPRATFSPRFPYTQMERNNETERHRRDPEGAPLQQTSF